MPHNLTRWCRSAWKEARDRARIRASGGGGYAWLLCRTTRQACSVLANPAGDGDPRLRCGYQTRDRRPPPHSTHCSAYSNFGQDAKKYGERFGADKAKKLKKYTVEHPGTGKMQKSVFMPRDPDGFLAGKLSNTKGTMDRVVSDTDANAVHAGQLQEAYENERAKLLSVKAEGETYEELLAIEKAGNYK